MAAAGRKSTVFFAVTVLQILLFSLMVIHAANRQRGDLPLIGEKRRLVRELGLTDLCLCTDARYTRHPAMADVHSPFQDHPFSLEHFPSGTLIPPPPHLKSSPAGKEGRRSP